MVFAFSPVLRIWYQDQAHDSLGIAYTITVPLDLVPRTPYINTPAQIAHDLYARLRQREDTDCREAWLAPGV